MPSFPFALISHFLVEDFFHALERSYSLSVAYVQQKDLFNNAFAGLSLRLIKCRHKGHFVQPQQG